MNDEWPSWKVKHVHWMIACLHGNLFFSCLYSWWYSKRRIILFASHSKKTLIIILLCRRSISCKCPPTKYFLSTMQMIKWVWSRSDCSTVSFQEKAKKIHLKCKMIMAKLLSTFHACFSWHEYHEDRTFIRQEIGWHIVSCLTSSTHILCLRMQSIHAHFFHSRRHYPCSWAFIYMTEDLRALNNFSEH